jgi:hypothetical protein
MGILEFCFYLSAKVLGYSAWIYLGLRLFRGDKNGFVILAILLSFARIAAGVLLGMGTLMVVATIAAAFPQMVPPEVSDTVIFMLLFLPARVLLWAGGAKLLQKKLSLPGLYWAIGGVVLSTLLDLFVHQISIGLC